MATAANKFTKNLQASHKDIRGKRAELISSDAEDAQNDLVRELQQKKRDLERKLLNLEDLSPDTELSLKPTKGDFDAKSWVREVHKTKVELVLLEKELEIAEGTQSEYFGS